MRLETQRPARVLPRFADVAFEGREDWVPPARLKVRWENIAESRAWEERWDRIHSVGLPLDDSREDAAAQVIEMLFREEEVSINSSEMRLRSVTPDSRVVSRVPHSGWHPSRAKASPGASVE